MTGLRSCLFERFTRVTSLECCRSGDVRRVELAAPGNGHGCSFGGGAFVCCSSKVHKDDPVPSRSPQGQIILQRIAGQTLVIVCLQYTLPYSLTPSFTHSRRNTHRGVLGMPRHMLAHHHHPHSRLHTKIYETNHKLSTDA